MSENEVWTLLSYFLFYSCRVRNLFMQVRNRRLVETSLSKTVPCRFDGTERTSYLIQLASPTMCSINVDLFETDIFVLLSLTFNEPHHMIHSSYTLYIYLILTATL
jgi:hypothetical protein